MVSLSKLSATARSMLRVRKAHQAHECIGVVFFLLPAHLPLLGGHTVALRHVEACVIVLMALEGSALSAIGNC